MPKTKVYEPEFKKKIVQLYLEEGRTIQSLNEEYQLGDGTVRKWVRAFREECETNPDLNDTKNLYEENRKLRRKLVEKKKELAFLKKAAAFFAKEID
ncbi:MAG: transposase [Hungatella sp.]|nr:transposase [Hungatella sp.]